MSQNVPTGEPGILSLEASVMESSFSPSAFLICRRRRCCCATAVMCVCSWGVYRRTWVVVVAGGLRDGVQLLAQRVFDLQAPPLLLCGRGQHQGSHQV